MTDRFKLPPLDHEKIYRRLEAEILASSSPSASPRIVIIGGQPGAGKSFLARKANALFFEGEPIAVLNGDDYRYEHPRAIEILALDDKLFAERTDPDVRVWTSRLLDATVKNRRNILFESTMRSKEPLMTTIRHLKERGYHIDIFVLAVPATISRVGIIDRYEQDKERFGYARWTPMRSHDEAYENLPGTVAAIELESPINSMNIYNRLDELLYRSEKGTSANNNLGTFANAAAALIQERNRDLSKSERQTLTRITRLIYKRMQARMALNTEITEVEQFLQ